MKYSPNEIAFLDYLNGLDRCTNLPDYWKYSYGINTQKTAKKFVEDGFIQYKKDYQKALMRLSVAELKEILKSNSLKVTGKKEILVERILGNVDIDWIEHNIANKKFYCLTLEGEQLLKEYELCVVNIKDRYYFNDSELKNAISKYKSFSTNDKIWKIYQQRIIDLYAKNKLSEIKYEYYSMANFLFKEDKFNVAITYYVAYFMLQFAILDNYSKIEDTYAEPNCTKQIKKCISLLELTNIEDLILSDTLCTNFKFFFSKEQMIQILIDSLNDEEYDYKKYKKKSKVNRTTNSNTNNNKTPKHSFLKKLFNI